MRIFTSLVAVIALIASMACLLMIPRYAAMYAEFGVALPVLTQFVLNLHWLLAGLFLRMSLVRGSCVAEVSGSCNMQP